MTSNSNQRSSRNQAACTSPCVLDLPLGNHLLAFPVRGAGGVDLVRVTASPSPTLYRRALGWRQKGGAAFVLGVLGASLGGTSFVTGAALLPTGLAKESHGLTLAGGDHCGRRRAAHRRRDMGHREQPPRRAVGCGSAVRAPGGPCRAVTAQLRCGGLGRKGIMWISVAVPLWRGRHGRSSATLIVRGDLTATSLHKSGIERGRCQTCDASSRLCSGSP